MSKSLNHTPSVIERPVYQMFNALPSSVSDRVRSGVFRAFGAPTLHPRLQVPRKPMFLTEGDCGVQVGTPHPKRVHQLREYVGETGRMLFIEPLSDNFERLTAAADQYQNVSLDNRAAGADAGRAELPVIDAGPQNNQIASDPASTEYSETKTEKVEVERLDAILSDYSIEPDAIEVMVNGSEHDVLTGAQRTLEEIGPRLLIKSFGFDPESEDPSIELISDLRSYGYNVSRAPTRRPPPSFGAPDGDVFAYK